MDESLVPLTCRRTYCWHVYKLFCHQLIKGKMYIVLGWVGLRSTEKRFAGRNKSNDRKIITDLAVVTFVFGTFLIYCAITRYKFTLLFLSCVNWIHHFQTWLLAVGLSASLTLHSFDARIIDAFKARKLK